jgi:hypothetical protein
MQASSGNDMLNQHNQQLSQKVTSLSDQLAKAEKRNETNKKMEQLLQSKLEQLMSEFNSEKQKSLKLQQDLEEVSSKVESAKKKT